MKPLCVVSCPIDTFSGYGARSRDFVESLIQLKGEEWDIRIMAQRWGNTPWNFLPSDHPYRQLFIGNNLPKRPDIWIQVTVPNEFQPVGQYNIGVTAGIETTIMPGEFIEGMNRMDLNLVSSKHSKQAAHSSQFEKRNSNGKVEKVIKLEKPCEVLFEGLDLSKYFKDPKKSGILDDVKEEFCFLYTGHWLNGKLGEDRKNTGLMIKTFLETFNTPSKNKPALILKTNQVNYSLIDRENILKKINGIKTTVTGNLPNIYLVHGELTDSEMNLLNNDSKVKAFVSFTKGEGYGRPLKEAAITGKPTIASNWSGHVDFLKPDYNCLIGGELKNVCKSAVNEWIIPESQWFSIDTKIASKAMKDVFKNYKKYIKNSRKQTQYLKDNWSFEKMKEKLNNLLPEVKVEAAPPIHQTLKLPKLKKVSNKKQALPKLKLPKLKKIES